MHVVIGRPRHGERVMGAKAIVESGDVKRTEIELRSSGTND
jgi:hypothetical protein